MTTVTDNPTNNPSRAYGRRPPKGAPALGFAAVRAAVGVPTHPVAFDSIGGWTGWQMLGNDAYGDCVSVTWASIRRIITRIYGAEKYPGIDAVLALYRTQNPDFDPAGTAATNGPGSKADGGMDIQTVLEMLVSIGGPDGVKALAFAKVDHTSIEEVKAAVAIFDFVWLGVDASTADERNFPATWDALPNDVYAGGHSIVGTGYDRDVFRMQTWGAEGALTLSYMGQRVEEAWVIVWPEHGARLDSAQRAALNTAFHAITGHDIDWSTVPPVPAPPVPTPTPVPVPIPTPTPTPVPVPTPTPDSNLADIEMAAAVRAYISRRHVTPVTKAMAAAGRKWLVSRNL